MFERPTQAMALNALEVCDVAEPRRSAHALECALHSVPTRVWMAGSAASGAMCPRPLFRHLRTL
jgi:hypothetical protein